MITSKPLLNEGSRDVQTPWGLALGQGQHQRHAEADTVVIELGNYLPHPLLTDSLKMLQLHPKSLEREIHPVAQDVNLLTGHLSG